MSFSDIISSATDTILSFLGSFSVTIHYQDQSPDVTVTAITKNPAMEEDYVPGTANPAGVTNLLLFVHFLPLIVAPRKGDTATVNGVDYDIWQVDVDREGGATLRMRRRNQRFDQ